MRFRKAGFVLVVFLLPMIMPSEISLVSYSSAETNCDNDGDFITPSQNKTFARLAKTPNGFYMYGDFFEYEGQDEDANNRGKKNQAQNPNEDYVGPEEDWMTWGTEHELDLLRDDFATRIDIGNDAVGTLQVNLDHERRTTICVTVEAINSTIDPSVDVYLMTDTQYDRYSAAYDVAHGYWSWDNHRDDDDQLDEVPPEWRSFTVSGWTSFRDSHQYENIDQVSFSVALDGPEIASGLFGGQSQQYFNIVVDNTNNSHKNDATPESEISAYITVVSQERTTILPNWTVSVLCCGLMMAVVAIPVVMNKKYMDAGLSLTKEDQQVSKGLVPSLEQRE